MNIQEMYPISHYAVINGYDSIEATSGVYIYKASPVDMNPLLSATMNADYYKVRIKDFTFTTSATATTKTQHFRIGVLAYLENINATNQVQQSKWWKDTIDSQIRKDNSVMAEFASMSTLIHEKSGSDIQHDISIQRNGDCCPDLIIRKADIVNNNNELTVKVYVRVFEGNAIYNEDETSFTAILEIYPC